MLPQLSEPAHTPSQRDRLFPVKVDHERVTFWTTELVVELP